MAEEPEISREEMVDMVAARGPMMVRPASRGCIYWEIRIGTTVSVEPSTDASTPRDSVPSMCMPTIMAPTTMVP